MVHTIEVRVNNGHNRYGEHLGYHYCNVGNSYTYGIEKPRYPMPALIYEVEYGVDNWPEVVIWTRNHNDPLSDWFEDGLLCVYLYEGEENE